MWVATLFRYGWASNRIYGTRFLAGRSVVTVTTKVIDMVERQGKRISQMVFTAFETTYENQKQEIVARARQRVICYQPEGASHG